MSVFFAIIAFGNFRIRVTGRCQRVWLASPITFAELRPFATLTLAGDILLAVGNGEELCRWGQAVAQTALTALAKAGPELELPDGVEVHVDLNGEYSGLGIKDLPPVE